MSIENESNPSEKIFSESSIWKILDVYFKDNPNALVRHHIDSYDDFYKNGLPQLFKEMNPLKIELDFDEEKMENRTKCYLYFGGKDASKIYYGKPTLHENYTTKYLFPNECRLKNMTYGMTIHYDIEIEIERVLESGETQMPVDANNEINWGSDDDSDNENNNKKNKTPSEYAKMKENMENNVINGNIVHEKMTLKDFYFGRFPIMVKSHFCVLNGMTPEMCYKLGECKHDYGGYFIIDGKEKTIVCQEKFGDNMIRIDKSSDDKYTYSLDIRSVSENTSKQTRNMSIKIVAPNKDYHNNNILVFIPNVRKGIPLFVVFRALGILSDKDIISFCTLQKAEMVSHLYSDFFNSSIHDANNVNNQSDALKYISLLVKQSNKNRSTYNEEHIAKVLHIFADYFLPHVGEMNFIDKAYHLGYMVNRLLLVALQMEPSTDRDHYKFKRVETVGSMLKELFKEYYKKTHQKLRRDLETRYFYNQGIYSHPGKLFQHELRPYLKERTVEIGIMKGFKGNWGSEIHTKRVGITQDLNRLSYNGMISHLRKTNLPISNEKLVSPHLLHGSQWGIIDPVDTPDGGNVGLHKYMAIMAVVSSHTSRTELQKWLEAHDQVQLLSSCVPYNLSSKTKIFLNGLWIGVTKNQDSLLADLKSHRRHALIPITTSIAYHIQRNTIEIFTDGGRLTRPVFYYDSETQNFSFQNKGQWNKIEHLLMNNKSSTTTLVKEKETLWSKLICGLYDKKIANFDPFQGKCYKWEELYNEPLTHIKSNKAVLEYIDSNETETSLVCLNHDTLMTNPSNNYTHMELHESNILSIMANLIIFPEHNPPARNCFSCGQSKQAASLYHSNYTLRMDKTAVVLNNGQIPLVKSQYLQYINQEEMPYGENAIVAIMCYTGYNVEDAILINEGALQRGLFRTTYYTTYETHEEREVKGDEIIKEKLFSNVIENESVMNTAYGFDYNKLDKDGIIPENTPVDDKTILIGISEFVPGKEHRKDVSKKPKKGQLGMVDKSFITEDEHGKRIAKVRIREERIPTFGDKFSSRAGQKGTVGMVIREQDMPYTKEGIRPDIIINPHAVPSRMTVGQLIESVIGKACAIHGSFGDCTAFRNKHQAKFALFGELLSSYGFHSSGNEIMYNGMTGEQLETNIFIGPTYYMRLKHMVKDKINFRARGPNTNLTKQPVSGRANDGGLRIGEMERDAVISHGLSAFLQESMTVRADDYKMAICNKTGTIAIYNPSKNIMFSPSADGPIRYTKSLNDEDQIEKITKYGRDFSIVRIPYSMKLLIQELQAINVRISIITEDNISQMDNMNFSNNIDLLLNKKNANIEMVIEQIKQSLTEEKRPEKLQDVTPVMSQDEMKKKRIKPLPDQYDDDLDDYSLPTPINSPQFQLSDYSANESYKPGQEDTDSIPYAPGSPAYAPTYDDSMPYATGSPAFNLQDDSGSENNMMVGGNVNYRGDRKPSRRWTIEEVLGNEYTIFSDDMELLEPGENVKIVNKQDIYPMDDSLIYMQDVNSPFSNQNNDMEHVPMIQPPQYNPNPYSTENPQGINFAPVIKIINEGSDYSQQNGDPMPSSQPQMYFDGTQNANGIETIESNTTLPSPSFPENTIDVNKITPNVIVEKK